MKNELEILKDRLKRTKEDLYYFWEDNMNESDPNKILVLWGKLQYMMLEKASIEWEIEKKEKELNHGRE